ncbi:MAG: hypothetical protein A4E53_01501 [Pelotomaculum sp. PtaB.Bin104]|nr:MAG: hypothetical protein A4E53_01501 [Pelotomaculum sp. PtaB.Bin104]
MIRLDIRKLINALIDSGITPRFDIDGNLRIEAPDSPLDFDAVLLLDEAENRREEISDFLHQSLDGFNPLDWRRREGDDGGWYCDPGWWKSVGTDI